MRHNEPCSSPERTQFSVTTHYPAGFVTPAQLRRLAEAAETEGAVLKLAGDSIMLLGLSADARGRVQAALGLAPAATHCVIRSISSCPGRPYCQAAQQDAASLARELDSRFWGLPVPGKVRIAVSGCANCCAEVFVKDIGLFGTPDGYTLVLGGNSGRRPQIAQAVARGIPAETVPRLVGQILEYYQGHARSGERMGVFLERLGLTAFITAVIPAPYQPIG